MSIVETIVSLALSLFIIGGGVTFIANEIIIIKKIEQKITKERNLLLKIHEKISSQSCLENGKTILCKEKEKTRVLYKP